MNWERIEGNWEHYRGNAKRRWLKLTDEQLDLTWGKREELAAKIEQAYGISRDQAEKQLASWQGAQKY
jgi:uncharacterized protein YjbJ (UPF0337 family)